MFGIGMPELLIIFVIALLVFGPKELPKIGRTIGRAMGEFRRASDDLKEGIQREMEAAERETLEPEAPESSLAVAKDDQTIAGGPLETPPAEPPASAPPDPGQPEESAPTAPAGEEHARADTPDQPAAAAAPREGEDTRGTPPGPPASATVADPAAGTPNA